METQLEDKEFDRTKGLGGSDIPALLGFSKWKTPLDLYLEKTGEKENDITKQNTRHILNMGKMLEPYVIQSFQEDEGVKVIRQQERIFHPKHKFLWGTIDGMCGDQVIEIKTTSSYVTDWKNNVPLHVLAQVAYYAHLLNSAGAKIIVMFRDTGEIRTYSYQRNQDSEEQMINHAIKFWDSVCKKTPPAPTSYEECQLLFKDVAPDKKVIATGEDITTISKMLQLKKEIDEKEKAYDVLKTSICSKLEDAPLLVDEQGNCLVTWKERNSSRLSTEALKTAYPAAYSECLLKSTVRNFSIRASEANLASV
ncbi:putative YqaJ domain-containing protein [Gammaproteobacteria bacterium]